MFIECMNLKGELVTINVKYIVAYSANDTGSIIEYLRGHTKVKESYYKVKQLIDEALEESE